MTDREIMQQALEALEANLGNWAAKTKAIAVLRERLAQPEHEPFGYFRYDLRLDAWVQNREGRPGTPFYTTPPQRKPLTDVELADLWYKQSTDWMEFARAIEAAHGIKEQA